MELVSQSVSHSLSHLLTAVTYIKDVCRNNHSVINCVFIR
jgi:hypothetical protein